MSDIDECSKSVERLTRDRGEVMRVGNDKIAEIRARHEVDAKIATVVNPQLPPSWTLAGWRAHDDRGYLLAEIERLTREHDEARAEVERLRDALVLGSEVLASHQGSPGREWHSGGAWLYPGDRINVMRAPLPEMEAKP